MSRTTGYCRKVRENYFLPVPDRAINPKKTRNRKRNVPSLFDERARIDNSGRKKQSGFKTLYCGCAIGKSAVLGAFFALRKMSNSASTRGDSKSSLGSRRYVRSLDQEQENTRANWVTTIRYLAATGTTHPTLVRDVLTGTTLPRTRTTTSGRVSSVTTISTASITPRLIEQTHSNVVSQICPASANTLRGSTKRLVGDPTAGSTN